MAGKSSEVLELHGKMIAELSTIFTRKQLQKIFDQTELRGLLTKDQKDKVDSMESLFSELKSRGKIDHGYYEKILPILVDQDVESKKIIEDYTEMIRKKRDAGYSQGCHTEGEDSRAGPKPKKTQISSRDPLFEDEHEMAQKRPRNAGALRKPINDTHDARIVYTLKKAMDAVGFIEGPCCTGTGFRVGEDKILTAYHVAEGITRKDKHSEPDRSLLETDDVCIKFNFLKGSDNLPTFYFEDELWGDKEMDFAVLQLRVKDKTTGACYPEGIKRFKHASPKNMFALLGHPDGKPMQWDPNVRILESNEGEKRLEEMKTYWSSKPIGQEWGYPDIGDKRSVLFDCWVQHGASGSPGIEMETDGEPACSLMLIHGYPDFVFDKEKYQVVPDDHPYMIEQGVTMEAIANKLNKMGKDAKAVKKEIFADIF